MFAKIRAFLFPPTFSDQEEENRNAQIVNAILLVGIVLLAILLLSPVLSSGSGMQPVGTYILSGQIFFFTLLLLLLRRGYLRLVTRGLMIVIFLGTSYAVWIGGGVSDVIFTAFATLLLLSSLLLSWRETFFIFLLVMASGWTMAYLQQQGILQPEAPRTPTGTMITLTIIFSQMIVVLYLLASSLQTALKKSEQANRNLHELSEQLEERVKARTQDLTLSAELANAVARIRELPELLSQSVELIRARFNLYHVQIYLLDEAGSQLVLRASTGEAGRSLLARGHRLPLNGRSLNGKAALTKTLVLVADTATEPLFQPNPLLPNTRAEIAIPLLVGERLVGVVDLQSERVGAFSEESLLALNTLAGQLAVAIDNATLFSERQRAEEEARKFKLGIDYANDAIFLTDTDGQILYVNPRFEEMYGWSAAEAIGQTPRILKSGLVPPEAYRDLWQRLLNKEVVTGETINRTKDGRFLSVERANTPILNEAGDLIGFLSVQTDVTQRKQAEARLARSVAELNCLNDLGRKVEEQPPVPEFLQWATQRIPAAMSYPEHCLAAITLGETVYGDARALSLPRHIVEGLRIDNELVGRLILAYEDAALPFENEDSAFIGSVGRRISSYLEGQRLLAQVQARATEMETVAQIGTAVARDLDINELLQDAVSLTKERFGLYHVHIYLMDETGDELNLAAGSGEIGQMMVSEGRKISLRQEQSLVARAARLRQGVMVNDVRDEPGFLPHPLLPHTRAELAVPLLAGEQVLGVLDVQASEPGYFKAKDVNIYTTLATQVAAALQNARQFAQTQAALENLQILQQAFVREGWQSFYSGAQQRVQGFVASGQKVRPITDATTDLPELIHTQTAVVQPIQLGGINLGGLGVRLTTNSQLTETQRALLESLSREVSQALERARLAEQTRAALDETQQRTAELAILNEMSQALTAQTSVDGVLEVVYRFTSRLMDTTNFYIALYDAEQDEIEFTLEAREGRIAYHVERRRAGQGLTEYIIRHRQPLLIPEDVDGRLQELGVTSYGRRALSWLGVPMVLGDQVLGVLAVQSYTQPRVYHERHLQLLTAVASQAAIAIENARLIEATAERARQEQLLREISTRVSATVDPEFILRSAAEEIGRALGLETFVILQSDPEDGQNGHAVKAPAGQVVHSVAHPARGSGK